MANFEGFEEFRRRREAEHQERVRGSLSKEHINEEIDSLTEDELVTHEIERRPRHQRIKKVRRTFRIGYMVACLVIIAIMIIFALIWLPIPFGTVIVEGNRKISTEDIYRVAEIGRPVNILQLRSADIEYRLRHDLRVQTAEAHYEFPWTIRITVTDRTPAAVMQSEFDYAVLSDDGVVMELSREIQHTEAPFISGQRLGNISLGEVMADESVKKALQYLHYLSPQGRKQIAEINVSDPTQLIAYTRDDIAIRLGRGENMAEQAPLSEHMLNDIRARNLDVLFIDANVGAPFVKLK